MLGVTDHEDRTALRVVIGIDTHQEQHVAVAIVKGGGKLDRVGGSIGGLWRRKTVPSTVFRKVGQQLMESEMDVQSGVVRARPPCLPTGGDERSGSLQGVQSAPGHGAQGVGLFGTTRLPVPEPAKTTEA